MYSISVTIKVKIHNILQTQIFILKLHWKPDTRYLLVLLESFADVMLESINEVAYCGISRNHFGAVRLPQVCIVPVTDVWQLYFLIAYTQQRSELLGGMKKFCADLYQLWVLGWLSRSTTVVESSSPTRSCCKYTEVRL